MARWAVFNRFKAATYARQYAQNYDPAYADLSHAAIGGGGDCTNFVSQALLAGGWTMISGLGHNLNTWWYEDKPTGSWWQHYIHGYASNTWVYAAAFREFLASSSRVSACDESDLTIGDIVQARNIGADLVDHTMIVSMVDPGGAPRVSYHTTNVLDAPLKDTKAKFGQGVDYLYWKVRDIYLDYDMFDGAAEAIIAPGPFIR